jgi:ketosteroid isomerase-like protein
MNGDDATAWFADDYVHITPDGRMTKSWRVAPSINGSASLAIDKLQVRLFGDVGVAAYLWRVAGENRTSGVVQVLQRRHNQWRILATQVGGADPIPFPIVADGIQSISNEKPSEAAIRNTWGRFMAAVNLRTSTGARAEDLDTVRSIFAEDALYVDANGNAFTREERLAAGHKNALQLTGRQKDDAVVVPGLYVPDHVDVQVAVFGDAAVWTSRNPANGDQSVRVWQKRVGGWQMIAMRHGMSYR